MDPFSAAASFVTGLIRTHKMDQWARLIFAMSFSYWSSFSYACGAVLVAGGRFPVAIGTGMLTGACAIGWLWMQSPLTRGTMAAVPQEMDVFTSEVKGIEHDK